MATDMDFEKLGELVKTWALGDDRLKIPVPNGGGAMFQWPKPVTTDDPAKIEALRQQFKLAGTNFVLPPEVTKVIVEQSSSTCFVLKLPAKDAILKHEEWLKTNNYATPPFYTDPLMAPDGDITAKLRLDDARIGDYTISNCAG